MEQCLLNMLKALKIAEFKAKTMSEERILPLLRSMGILLSTSIGVAYAAMYANMCIVLEQLMV